TQKTRAHGERVRQIGDGEIGVRLDFRDVDVALPGVGNFSGRHYVEHTVRLSRVCADLWWRDVTLGGGLVIRGAKVRNPFFLACCAHVFGYVKFEDRQLCEILRGRQTGVAAYD